MFFESKSSSIITPEFLFNRKEYLIQSQKDNYTAYVSLAGHTLLCQMSEVKSGCYISGYRATFGGIEGTDIGGLDEFIKSIISELRLRNARSLIIRQAPECYHFDFSKACHEVFLQNEFELITGDTNQHIFVNNSFEEKIDIQEKRRLRKLKETGVVCKLYTKAEGDEWYDVLLKSRAHKNYPVTLSKEAYYGLADTFPDTYTYAGVYINDQMIASAVFVRISAESIYYFMPASDPDYNYLSPAVLILDSMYNMALQQNCSIIDLGISSVDGVLNEGLHKFKKHMGALDSRKNTYKYNF